MEVEESTNQIEQELRDALIPIPLDPNVKERLGNALYKLAPGEVSSMGPVPHSFMIEVRSGVGLEESTSEGETIFVGISDSG